MVNVLFTGCSYFVGDGLTFKKSDPANAVNIFTKKVFGNDVVISNLAESGNSNLSIYFDTAQAMYNQPYDYVFVGVTSYPRYNFYMGLETYDFKRRTVFSPFSNQFSEHNGHNGEFSATWLKDLRDKFLAIHNDHFEILDIIKHQNLLINQSKLLGTKLYFINNICHWDKDYFKRLSNPLPNNLTRYTKQLLDTHNRDDIDIATLYNLIHNDYESSGNIQEDYWLNLYDAFYRFKVDLGLDNYHPGPESHKNFGSFLAKQLTNLNG